MTDVVTEVVDEVKAIVTEVTQEGVKLWSEFLGGIVYLRKEATVLATWLENADPALAAQAQALLTEAEAAAQQLATHQGTALANFVSTKLDAAEQTAATDIQSLTGNTPLGVTAGALATAGLTDLATTVKNITTVGYAKAVAGLLQAAGVK